MRLRHPWLVCSAALVIAALSSVTVAAQKGKPAPAPAPTGVPVSADLRCPQAADCASAERIDRITGDGLGPYVGTAAGQGAFLNDNNKLHINYTTSYGRAIVADFGDFVANGACAAAGTCRKNFDIANVRATSHPSITNPVNASQDPLPNGFYDIPVGGSSKARFKLDFADPAGRALMWTVRFNAEMYPGTTDLTVTRTSVNTWIVEATTSDVAELVAINTGKGKTIMTREGFYTMPFKITVTR